MFASKSCSASSDWCLEWDILEAPPSPFEVLLEDTSDLKNERPENIDLLGVLPVDDFEGVLSLVPSSREVRLPSALGLLKSLVALLFSERSSPSSWFFISTRRFSSSSCVKSNESLRFVGERSMEKKWSSMVAAFWCVGLLLFLFPLLEEGYGDCSCCRNEEVFLSTWAVLAGSSWLKLSTAKEYRLFEMFKKLFISMAMTEVCVDMIQMQ